MREERNQPTLSYAYRFSQCSTAADADRIGAFGFIPVAFWKTEKAVCAKSFFSLFGFGLPFGFDLGTRTLPAGGSNSKIKPTHYEKTWQVDNLPIKRAMKIQLN